MIGWCDECREETVDIPDFSGTWRSDMHTPVCEGCLPPWTLVGTDFSSEYFNPKPGLLCFRGLDGTLYTEEVTTEEYNRVVSGHGSTPRYDLGSIFSDLYKGWGDTIKSWQIYIGDSEDHIERGYN